MGVNIENPVKLTPEVRAKLEEAAALDCTWEEMAFYAGISKSSLYNWLGCVEGLKERLDELKLNPFLRARKSVIEGLENNPEFSLKYLERKKKDEFSMRMETDLTSKGEKITGFNYVSPDGNNDQTDSDPAQSMGETEG